MKNKQKWMTVVAASVLTLSLSAPTFAASGDFSDISKVPGHEKIESLKDRGFINGVTDDQFKPNQTINSAQGVQMIVKSFQLSLAAFNFIKAPEAKDSYDNVKDNVWYSDAFIIAKLNGVDIPENVNPASKMTKEQFTTFVMQAMEKAGNLPMINIKPVDIKDDSKINPSYQGAIQRSLALDINTLDSKGNFDPKGEVTRAEAAVMIYNALEYMSKIKTPTIDPIPEPSPSPSPSDDSLDK
ncbi:S-layer homology domain-containing protein [Paenibacillus kyungheensis]|uniref:S-layer homology domain-containing protein n=1 Tax=Paenibacillus kyungheensis TaxID=1452732 RepID=A0AAX3LY28_9BACL|nr:S-layer homology domain-containing protein [Paenibacillus kyungheensis]WCT54800.1 S-layer homology domain-containing protein [Paenibacillus kyungheensis]